MKENVKLHHLKMSMKQDIKNMMNFGERKREREGGVYTEKKKDLSGTISKVENSWNSSKTF